MGMRIFSVVSYLLVPLRLLPERTRAALWFEWTTLIFLLEDCDSGRDMWKSFKGWWALRRLTHAAGQVFALKEPMTYQRKWLNVRGKAPVEEMIAWMRKAVNAGPGVGFSMGLYVDQGKGGRHVKATWGDAFGVLSDFLSTQEGLRAALAEREFDGETLMLNILPAAALGGIKLRELPAD